MNIDNNTPLVNKFTFNQEVIWVSTFGYEIGRYLGLDDTDPNKYLVDLNVTNNSSPTPLW